MLTQVQGFPLSPQQKRIWSLVKQQEQSIFRAQSAVLVEGELQEELLKKALAATVERNEILRTSFQVLPGTGLVVQVVEEEAAYVYERTDVSALDERAQQAEADAIFERLLQTELNAATGAVLHLAHLQLADDRHQLILALPALSADAMLQNVVLELCAAYEACRDGVVLDDEDVLQYAVAADFFNETLEAEESEIGREFWKKQPLDGLAVELPFANTQGGAYQPVLHTAPLDGAAVERLEKMAAGLGVQLSSVLLAAWSALLGRVSGEPAVVVGVNCDGRSDEEIVEALGPYSRYVPLACAVEGAVSFAELARTVDAAQQKAYDFQECFDWDLLAGKSLPEGMTGPNFGFEYGDRTVRYERGGLAFAVTRQYQCLERFGLKLGAVRTDAGLALELYRDGSLYTEADAGRLLEELHTMLTEGLQNGAAALETLRMVGANETQLQVTAFNRTEKTYAADALLHELFTAQALRTPDAAAVEANGETLTFAQLDARANQLARHLQALGVAPGTVTGIALERSLSMVLSMLAVLKAGGAYLPLDPDYPQERLAYMLEDAQATVLLTESRFAETRLGVQRVCLDTDWEAIALLDASLPEQNAKPEDPAYVIYTSGSTGKPKGVVIAHRAICNHMFWMQEEFPLTADDVVLQKTSFSFDASVWEFYAPLLSGAKLLMAQPGGHADPDYLIKTIQTGGVTILQLVPTMLHVLLGDKRFADCTSLRRMYCGGEALTADLAGRFLQRLPETALINLYGPTEGTIDATFHLCLPDSGRGSIPIGRPIANVHALVLSETMELLPLGAPGELYIGGTGLANGYLHRPDLTAERFVDHPFASGERLYKTGDLVRLGADGLLEYLGRVDHQVKLRGFRIELGEIEMVLEQHASVARAAVVAHEAEPGDVRIVAYLTAAADGVSVSELRAHLQAQLPEYMVPALLMTLETMPLLPNGKVDRKALPEPDFAQGAASADFAAPGTVYEVMLADVWKRVLGQDRLSIHDNFFELGGHSLSATQLVSQIQKTFQVKLSLRIIFEAPTIATLAKKIESFLKTDSGVEETPMEQADRQGRLPLSFGQQRMWLLQQLDPAAAAYNVPTAVRLHGALDRSALERSLNEMLRRHEILRTSYREVDGELYQEIAEYAPQPLTVLNLTHLKGAEQEAQVLCLAEEDAHLPFDLTQSPVFRATLAVLSAEEHVLYLNRHHIASDGWSLEVFAKEVAALYEAFAAGSTSPLTEPELQYADYANWQREHLAGEMIEGQLAYWKEHLGTDWPLLQLPTDHPRPAKQSFKGGYRALKLPKSLLNRLYNVSQEEGVTLYMTLLAAFKTLLARYSGQDDIRVGTPIAGRSRGEVADMLGFFVNTLVLRTDLSGGVTFRELLGRVRKTALGAYAHQDLPFEKLIEELKQGEEDGNGLIQVWFVFQQAAELASLRLPGLEAENIVVHNGTTKWDLTLGVEEHADGLLVEFEYNSDLFEEPTILRMMDHFSTLLESVSEAPDTAIGTVSLLQEPEQMMLAINETSRQFAADLRLHELFEAQAKRTPERTAVVFDEQTVSYRLLNEQANQLARRLQSMGIARGQLVGVCAERSPELVVALLAVLKAGAAYLPIDPDYPQDRIRHMIDDSGLKALLTQANIAPTLPTGEAQVIALDADWAEIAGESTADLGVTVQAEDPAYVIYTSGSTGMPKGVAVPHRAIVNHMQWMQEEFPLGEQDAVLQKTAYSFDASVWEFWAPLLAGAQLVLALPGEHTDPDALVKRLRQHNITTLQLVPSMLNLLLSHTGFAEARSLSRVFCGGEALSLELQSRFFHTMEAELINLYGPTEACIDATFWRCQKDTALRTVPIGRPIANLEVLVLDETGQPVPAGVPGELHIGGAGLALGYLHRPELTAERFVPHPFQDGARLYKTGDLVRLMPQGVLEYLGRIDQQVKVRGFRIELGEIEAVLEQQPAVQQAVANVSVQDGDARIYAYWINKKGWEADEDTLRSALQNKLPEYMQPTALLELEAFPLLPNGKIDKKALPLPEQSAKKTADYVAPRNMVEEMIAEIWQELLRVDRVSIHSTFQQLGGHSLLAFQAVARLREAFDLPLSLRQLFETPTVAELADVISAKLLEELDDQPEA